MSRFGGVGPIAWRELSTVVRTRGYLLLSGGLLAVFFGVLRAGGGIEGGYVPAVVDLLLPIELLVPLVAVALGYRAFSGENDDRPVLRTYPVSERSLAIGVFAGRFVGLAAIVGAPLAIVGVVISQIGGPPSLVFATHRGVDSPILFVRFVTLTVGFGAAVLAMTMAAAALVRTSRATLAVALTVLVAVVAGGDLLAVIGLSADAIEDELLGTVLALAPNAAYRGLVFESVVGVATDRGSAIDVLVAVAGLFGWTAVSLAIVELTERRLEMALGDRLRAVTGRIRNALYR